MNWKIWITEFGNTSFLHINPPWKCFMRKTYVSMIVWYKLFIQTTCGYIFLKITSENVIIYLSYHILKCLDRGSNTGPLDLQSNALPTELSRPQYPYGNGLYVCSFRKNRYFIYFFHSSWRIFTIAKQFEPSKNSMEMIWIYINLKKLIMKFNPVKFIFFSEFFPQDPRSIPDMETFVIIIQYMNFFCAV